LNRQSRTQFTLVDGDHLKGKEDETDNVGSLGRIWPDHIISVWAALLDMAVARQGGPPQPWIPYLVGPVFALVGALILARQPGNRVGWLLLLPGLSAFVLTDAYFLPLNNGLAPLPPTLTPVLWLALWYSNWNWALLIFPLLVVDAAVPHRAAD
jgi:hypothetical protein